MNFLELPNELLIEIGAYLQLDPLDSITQAAQTCRRLYDIWISQILAERVATIRSMMLARKVLICDRHEVMTHATFEPGAPFRGSYFQAVIQIHPAIKKKELAAVRSFICRATTLESADIQLWDFNDIPKLAYILRACAERPNLQLDVTNMYPRAWDTTKEPGPFAFEFPQHDPIPSSVPNPSFSTNRITTLFFNMFRPLFTLWPRRSITCNPSTARIPPGASSPPATYGASYTVTTRKPRHTIAVSHKPLLTGVSFDGSEWFSASLYPWTIHTLNNAPITRLSLDKTSLTLFDWCHILPAITMPSLTQLTIGHLSVAFPDLRSFLQRHPTITILDLAGNQAVGMVDLPAPDSNPSFLPFLQSLTANSQYILPFVQYQDRGNFSSLRRLHVKPLRSTSAPSERDYPYPVDHLYPIFDAIGRNPNRKLTLVIDVLDYSGLLDWLMRHSPNEPMSLKDDNSAHFLHPLPGLEELRVISEGMSLSNEATQRVLDWMSTHNPALIPDSISPNSCPNLTTIKLGREGRSEEVVLTRTWSPRLEPGSPGNRNSCRRLHDLRMPEILADHVQLILILMIADNISVCDPDQDITFQAFSSKFNSGLSMAYFEDVTMLAYFRKLCAERPNPRLDLLDYYQGIDES
ncbi:hypothetical protein NLJ89_g8871 [Agrocybe chaxingu]|uniref:F-box domain-containing protein n=1 Tax=Agrocybe chaxingu TaxID=84603 RepID=A0A9W8MU33_9AGAR|nr:hypothetical protein NLJ89_g8871 [Agrocybe chaxingu]